MLPKKNYNQQNKKAKAPLCTIHPLRVDTHKKFQQLQVYKFLQQTEKTSRPQQSTVLSEKR